MERLKLVMSGGQNPYTRHVDQTPPSEHLQKRIEATRYKEPLFDPAIHAGLVFEKVSYCFFLSLFNNNITYSNRTFFYFIFLIFSVIYHDPILYTYYSTIRSQNKK